MKVITPEVDLKTWSQEANCTNCTSVVGVENEDIHYEYEKSGKCYWTKCILCHNRILFRKDDLPKMVTADADKHRAIYHYSND